MTIKCREDRHRITGGAFYCPLLRIKKKFPKEQISVTTIENRFFGVEIKVSSLITRQDLIEQLFGFHQGERFTPQAACCKGMRGFSRCLILKEFSEA